MKDYIENFLETRVLSVPEPFEEAQRGYPLLAARDNPKFLPINGINAAKGETGEKNSSNDLNIHANFEQIILKGLGGEQINNKAKFISPYASFHSDRPRASLPTIALAIKFGNKLSWVQSKRTFIPTIMKAGLGKELNIYFLRMGRICKALRGCMNSLDRLIGLRMQYASTPKMIRLYLTEIFSYTMILGKTMNFIVKRLRIMRQMDAEIITTAAKVTSGEVFRKDELELIKAYPELRSFASVGTLSPSHFNFNPQVLFDLSVGQKSFKKGLSWLIYGTKVLQRVLKEIKYAARLLKKMGTLEEGNEQKKDDKDTNKNHKYAAEEVLDKYNESKGESAGYGGEEVGEGPANGGEDWKKPTKMGDKDVSFGTKGAFTEEDRSVSRKMTKKILMNTRYVGQFFKELETGRDTKTLQSFGIKMDDKATLSMFNNEQNEIESAVGSMLTHDI